jgi:hypothetical protein
MPLQPIAHRILAEGADARAEHAFSTFGLDAVEGTALASAAQEDGIKDGFGGNTGLVAAIGQGLYPMREVEHLIEPDFQLVSAQAWGCLPFLPPWFRLFALQQAAQIEATNGSRGLLKTLMEFDPAADLLDQLGGDMEGLRFSLG